MKCFSIFYFITIVLIIYKIEVICLSIKYASLTSTTLSSKLQLKNVAITSVLDKDNKTDTTANNTNIPLLSRNQVALCKNQCDKISIIYGCYCDLGCLQYGDCCELYLDECQTYFNSIAYDSFNLPTDNTSTNENKGTCCNKNQPPTNCFCDYRCEYLGDCCPDYNKCNQIQTGTLKKTENEANITNKETNAAVAKVKSKKKKSKKDKSSSVNKTKTKASSNSTESI